MGKARKTEVLLKQTRKFVSYVSYNYKAIQLFLSVLYS